MGTAAPRIEVFRPHRFELRHDDANNLPVIPSVAGVSHGGSGATNHRLSRIWHRQCAAAHERKRQGDKHRRRADGFL